MNQRIWVVSELYYPELTSTGYFLTGIAEGLAENLNVSVLCGQPSYWARGERAPAREARNGVEVHRCWATTLDKNCLVFKLINLITISISIFFAALLRVREGDILICVTNPPLLPYFSLIACRLKRARFVVLIHDVYPEILTALGIFARDSLVIRLFGRASRLLYENCDRILVVGRDMQRLIAAKLDTGRNRVIVAGNWANTELIVPKPRLENRLLKDLKLDACLVVQFWGNMGRPHCIEDLVDAAQLLASDHEIHFLLIGWGTKTPWAIAAKQARGLTNLTILEPFPREESCNVQNACDVAINTLFKGMAGISVPSRTYNALAAGKPVLAVCDEESELAAIVKEDDIGWVVPPGRPDLIASVLLSAKADRSRLRAMGERAHKAVKAKYCRSHVIQVFLDLIDDLRAS